MTQAEQLLHQAARVAFSDAFHRPAQVVASAPGRVNLLGEHTDYNQGFVLPTTVPRRTCVAFAPRDDRRVRVYSEALAEHAELELGQELKTGTFIDYVQGVTAAAREHGLTLTGFEAWITTQLPLGAGLSSSAALSVACLRAMKTAFGWSLDDVSLAQLAQWGENNIVGAPVGILDPLACHLGRDDTALFIDTRSLEHEHVPLPSDAEIVIADSGVRHAHATGGYRQRRLECERAAEALCVPSLRDVNGSIAARAVDLPAPLDRRVRHVLTENDRVLHARDLLRSGDLETLGELFNASHASMRDDFEVSIPEVDRIVDAAVRLEDVWGARLTGGGFGGSVVCLVERGAGESVARALEPLAAGVLVSAWGGTP